MKYLAGVMIGVLLLAGTFIAIFHGEAGPIAEELLKKFRSESDAVISQAEKSLVAVRNYAANIHRNYILVQHHLGLLAEKKADFESREAVLMRRLEFIRTRVGKKLPVNFLNGKALSYEEIDQAIELLGIEITAVRDALAVCRQEEEELLAMTKQLRADAAEAPVRLAELEISYSHLIMVRKMQEDRLALMAKLGSTVDLKALYKECKNNLAMASAPFKKDKDGIADRIDFDFGAAEKAMSDSESRIKKIDDLIAATKTSADTINFD